MASSDSLAKRIEEAKKKIETRPQWLKERTEIKDTLRRDAMQKPHALTKK